MRSSIGTFAFGSSGMPLRSFAAVVKYRLWFSRVPSATAARCLSSRSSMSFAKATALSENAFFSSLAVK